MDKVWLLRFKDINSNNCIVLAVPSIGNTIVRVMKKMREGDRRMRKMSGRDVEIVMVM